MFTGIVIAIGTIRSVEQRGDLRLVIATDLDLATAAIGASIACSGTCLTVVDKGTDWFAVDVSGETVARTAADRWTEASRLNLERSLRVGDELGGHIVTGHVEGVATVTRIEEDGDSWRVDFAVGGELAFQIATKGSITIDGVSLTVNTVTETPDGATFSVNLIPHTRNVTTLADLRMGSQVNVEVDILARYLARMRDRLPV